ncbi:putative G-protein coupled receptor 61, partial [Antrostomus carolinensis]
PPNSTADGKPKDVASKSVGLFFMLLIDLTAIVGNAAVMTVIVKTPALRKFVFVFHLCLVDFLAALTPMPYEVRMTVGLVACVLFGVWLKAVATSLVPVLGWLSPDRPPVLAGRGCSLQWSRGPYCKFFVIFFAAFYFLLPLLIIVVVYCSMFKVARVAAMHHGPLPTWMETPRRRSESLSSRSTMVGGQFLFCWLPYFSFHLYTALSTQPLVGPAAETVVTWLGYFCFTSNPFFYGCLNRQIRGELGRLLTCFFKQPPEEDLRL